MKHLSLILITILSLLVSSCSVQGELHKRTVYAMDTVITLQFEDDEMLDEMEKMIYDMDLRLSSHRSVSMLNNPDEWDDDMRNLVSDSLEFCRYTGGNLDITLKPVIDYYHEEGDIDEKVLEERLSLTGMDRIRDVDDIPSYIQLDLGGVAKGYAADRLRKYASSMGVERGIIDLGGDICIIGRKISGDGWNVGITDPRNPDELALMIKASDISIFTSGDYRRRFRKGDMEYHHIIDPATGYPADSGLSSVTVACSSPFYADCLATALFVMGYDEAMELYHRDPFFEAIFITHDGEILYTDEAEEKLNPQVVGVR